jgi:hypothetical protein
MGKLLLGLLFLVTNASTGWCGDIPAIPVSLCALESNPARYNGKMVRVRGSVVHAEGLYLSAKCGRGEGGVALSFPLENSTTPQPFQLVRDEAFERFKDFIEHDNAPVPKIAPSILEPESSKVTPHTAPRYCSIQVTVIGRFMAVSANDAGRGHGFGHLGLSPFQVVVRSVKDPEAKECASPSLEK